MNKVYKVIWSKVKNCYVVASELAKSHTKAPKSGIIGSVSLESKINSELYKGFVAGVFPMVNTPVVKSSDFKITVAAIVKNEAENVPTWVQAARSCADEIVVVDTGSTDGTVERFADYGIKCFHYDWHDDFASAKNYMISLCHGDWIVLLDGDEWFREGCDVRKAIAKHHNNPVTKAIIADWICLDKDRNNAVMFSGGAVRAFRNQPDVRYFRKVHENLTINYENFAFEPEFKMYHTGYSGSVNRSKHERNLRIMRTMFDFDNGKVEYPTDWRYIEDTYAGLGEFDKALWAADKMISYGVQEYSAAAWVTKFNVLFCMKAAMERMNREFDYCFRTVPSVSGFRFLASIYYMRNGRPDIALEHFTEGVRMLMGPQDRVAQEHTYWRMYLPEATALVASYYLQHGQSDVALVACSVCEQYCGKTNWVDPVFADVRRQLRMLGRKDSIGIGQKVLPLLESAKKGIAVAAMASGLVVGTVDIANPVFAACCNLNGDTTNQTTGSNSTVSGGRNNTAGGSQSSVAGGCYNNAGANLSFVAGGVCNTAAGIDIFETASAVFGGANNLSCGMYSVVVGGNCNTASGKSSLVSGGHCNTAEKDYSSVSGGSCNTASGCYSSISGGSSNIASGERSSVSGGGCNIAGGRSSWAAGGLNGLACADYSTAIGGGIANAYACYAVAIGACATATKKYEVAIGSERAPITLGGNITVTGTQKVSDGTNTKTWTNIIKGYSLPQATSAVLGGVKIGSNITNFMGTISLTKENVTAALGYTPPTADTNTTYAAMSADELTTGTATTSRSMTAKVLGDYVKGKTDDKISDMSVSGDTITYTKGDGTTGTLSVPTASYPELALSDLNTGTSTTANTISAKILNDYVTDKLLTESTARTNADTALGTRVDNAIIAYQSADTGLSNRIGSLASDGNYIKKSDTNNVSVNLLALDSRAKTNADDIATEITNRGVAISGEATARSDADLLLSNRIGTIATNGNYIQSSNDVSANLQLLDAQIKDNANTLISQNTSITTLDNNAIKYDTSVENKARATLGGTQGTVLANLKSGAVTQTSMEAINGSQLYAVKQDITGFASDIQANATNIDALNSSVTAALSSVSASGLLVDSLDSSKADKSLSNLSDAGKRVLKTYAEDAVATYLAQQGLSVPATQTGTNNSNNNTLSITNAGNGSLHVGEGSYVNGTSSIAIGVGNQVNANNSGAFGDPSIINADASYVLGNDDTINTGATGSFIVGNDGVSDAKGGLLFGSNTKATASAEDGMALGNRTEVSAKNAIALGSGSIADIENTLSIGNTDLKRKIVNVADGDISQNSSEAITGAQLYITNENVKKNTEALEMKADVDAGNINTSDWASKLGIGKVEDGNVDLVTGGTVYDAIQSVKGNELVQTNGDAITIGANSTASVIDVSNANGQGRVITGVITDIDDASSVANVGYVNQISENIARSTNAAFQKMDNRINKVGANAAAIASLPTPTFDGDEKWAFSAGVGHYHGETAASAGAFYKPQDNVIVRVGGSFGNGDEMVGAGVSVSLNKGNTPAVSKAQLVRTINAQAGQIQQQAGQLQQQANEIAELKAMVADLAAKVK